MSNFDTKRFARYANFDLTINKNFYRNLALVLFVTIVGIVVLSFFMRWLTNSINANPVMYNDLLPTAFFILIVISCALCIAGGCTLHSLRNKQVRIANLTIPATNLEKYAWHVLVYIGGCALTAVLAVAVADLVNFLMTLMVFKTTYGIESLFTTVFSGRAVMGIAMLPREIFDVSMNGIPFPVDAPLASEAYRSEWSRNTNAVWFSCIASIFFTAAIYSLGNSLKYKFNIPLTYILLQVVGFILSILMLVGMIWLTSNYDKTELLLGEPFQSFIENYHIYHYLCGSLLIVAGVGFFVWAYRFYTKAQLCNKLNR